MQAAIITAAITGSVPKKADNPAVPTTIEEQVADTIKCFEAGARVIHLHVRDEDENPCSDEHRFLQLKERITKECPEIIIQFSTGGRSGVGKARGNCLKHCPEMASLTTGSVNFAGTIYENHPDLIDYLAGEMLDKNIKPEIELFDLGMLYAAKILGQKGILKTPLHVQFVLGIPGGMPAKESVLDFCISELKNECPDATWGAAGIGRNQKTVLEWAARKGGHVRTGLEDNIKIDRETLAPSNEYLVLEAAKTVEATGRKIATPSEARDILSLS